MIYDLYIPKITVAIIIRILSPPLFWCWSFLLLALHCCRKLSLHQFQLRDGGGSIVFTIEIIFYRSGSFNKGVLKWFHLVGYSWEVLLWRRDGPARIPPLAGRERKKRRWWKWHSHSMTSNSNPSLSFSLAPLNYTHIHPSSLFLQQASAATVTNLVGYISLHSTPKCH